MFVACTRGPVINRFVQYHVPAFMLTTAVSVVSLVLCIGVELQMDTYTSCTWMSTCVAAVAMSLFVVEHAKVRRSIHQLFTSRLCS